MAKKSTAVETADMTNFPRGLHNLMPIAMLASVFLLLGALPGSPNDRSKPETIDATAMGTSTQMGAVVGITVII